jgi:hypothetical protein
LICFSSEKARPWRIPTGKEETSSSINADDQCGSNQAQK